MNRPSNVFDETESAILNALYEAPNDQYDSYSLAATLNPTVKPSTPEALAAFIGIREATERLMSRGLVKAGNRNSGADGVYFRKLKLTTKGEKAVIQHRHMKSAKTSLSDEASKS
jgi:hypothetical protein